MKMMVESLQNEKIKKLVKLQNKNSERKKSGIFIVEGKQENERAQNFGFEAIEFYICSDIYGEELPKNKLIHLVSKSVYEKIAYRGTSEGIIGLYRKKENPLSNFIPQENSSIIVIEGIEKPGNLGAILRSCEAFGIDALIVSDSKVDFYNPNVIRSSVGCLFGMNIFTSNNEEVYGFLKDNNYNIFTTLMSEDAKDLDNLDLKEKSAIVFGTEHSGLSDFWKKKGVNTLVPMSGTIDSLNLSNAVAISCYEILRQNKKK